VHAEGEVCRAQRLAREQCARAAAGPGIHLQRHARRVVVSIDVVGDLGERVRLGEPEADEALLLGVRSVCEAEERVGTKGVGVVESGEAGADVSGTVGFAGDLAPGPAETLRRAGVATEVVPVAVFEARVDEAVSARRYRTVFQTPALVRGHTVVALFQIGVDEPVAACREHAGARTVVGIVIVAVVALLDARLYDAVTANCPDAGGETVIVVVVVAVVALLVVLHDAVTALG
jgi:hypothetical protein